MGLLQHIKGTTMKPRLILASTALVMATLAGTARADLAQDLATMPAEQALTKAMQGGTQSIEAVVSATAINLQSQPELLYSLIFGAVKASPEQAPQIVSVAIAQVPGQKDVIVSAASAAAEGDAAMLAAINQAATDAELLAQTETTEEAEIVEAEQTEVPAPAAPIPPPPAANSGPDDRPPAISLN